MNGESSRIIISALGLYLKSLERQQDAALKKGNQKLHDAYHDEHKATQKAIEEHVAATKAPK